MLGEARFKPQMKALALLRAAYENFGAVGYGMRPALSYRRNRSLGAFFISLVASCCLGLCASAQKPQNAPSQQEEPKATLRRQANLVVLRVVVRDAKGQAVSDLTKDDFQVFDNKKQQTISQFSVEAPGATVETATNKTGNPAASATGGVDTALRFTALFFDDLHMRFANLAQIREAAKRYLEKTLDAGDRVGIFSASGHGSVDFTSDRNRLEQALSGLQFETRFQKFAPCPDLTTYQAQLIDDGLDRDALAVGVQMTIACLCNGDEKRCPDPASYTKNQARQIMMIQDIGADSTLTALENLVRRLAEMRGERRIAMVSDGFLNKNRQYRLDSVVDRALQTNVIISTMDARGLYVIPPGGDASSKGLQLPPDLLPIYSNMQSTGMQMDADVLNYAAESTGGIFVENTNDLGAGLARIASLHETSYVLGFVPTDLKFNGQFHTLKVKLLKESHFVVQARRGYFAPRQAEDTATVAKQEVEEAIFSRENLTGLPMEVQTQLLKRDTQTANVSIFVRTDVRGVQFRKENGRNLDNLSLLVAVFDRDGNYVTSKEETVNLRLSDTWLEQVMSGGLPVTVKLDLKPGSYVVRTVIRESNSQKLGATSGDLEIP